MNHNLSAIYEQRHIRIGLLGGTFDPPHLGHMHMAECAMRYMRLDHMVFLICGNTPHKNTQGVTPPEHRLNMLKLAIEGLENYHIDEAELYSQAKSYTISSILRIKKMMCRSSRLYFIIGADSLMYLEKWHDAENLLKSTSFICVPRESFEYNECLLKIKSLKKGFHADIHYLKCSRLDAASADIRQLRSCDQPISGLVNPKVEKYILDNRVYDDKL